MVWLSLVFNKEIKMGMFSFCCKGCDHELKRNEFVRMNGCKGEYDGYGRNNGGFDFDNCHDDQPICWHEVCYQKATNDQKLDETPSKYAPNQGFGYEALEFLKGYDPCVETTYNVRADRTIHEGDNWVQETLLLVKTDNGFAFQDYALYERLYQEACDTPEEQAWYDSLPKDWYNSFTEEQQEKVFTERRIVIEAKIGMKNPEREVHTFDTYEEAVFVAKSLMPKGNCSLVVLGVQGKLTGAVYESYTEGDKNKVRYEIGKPASCVK